ncbi:hypothetical protein RLIN73S_04635 [Rhodanobacter lindaniclasticus]
MADQLARLAVGQYLAHLLVHAIDIAGGPAEAIGNIPAWPGTPATAAVAPSAVGWFAPGGGITRASLVEGRSMLGGISSGASCRAFCQALCERNKPQPRQQAAERDGRQGHEERGFLHRIGFRRRRPGSAGTGV